MGYNDLFGAPATGGDDSTPDESPSKPGAERETIGENDLFGAPALGDEPDPNEPETGPDKPDADPDKPEADPPAPDFEDLFGDRVLDSDSGARPARVEPWRAPTGPRPAVHCTACRAGRVSGSLPGGLPIPRRPYARDAGHTQGAKAGQRSGPAKGEPSPLTTKSPRPAMRVERGRHGGSHLQSTAPIATYCTDR